MSNGQRFGVATDYDYSATHARDRITVWSGALYSVFEADGLSLPSGAGYMLTTYQGDKVRVECPAPRDGDNFSEVDRLIGSALNAHYQAIEARYDPIDWDGHPNTPVSDEELARLITGDERSWR